LKGNLFIKDTALSQNDNNKDAFHHSDYVQNLKIIIEEHTPPFNIALIGKWGVGKSSVINMLRKELHGKSEYKIAEINAWKYEDESLKKAFLKNLWKALNEDKDISLFKKFENALRLFVLDAKQVNEPKGVIHAFKAITPYLWSLTLIWLITSIIFLLLFTTSDLIFSHLSNQTFEFYNSIFFFQSNIWIPLGIAPFALLLMKFVENAIQHKESNINVLKPIETSDEYESLFKEEIRKHKDLNPDFSKLIVIVDDLDRLSSKKVVNALDAIKAFVDVEECIFIVACDEDILVSAIEKQKLNKTSEDIDGELFLDKLFQFRVALPPIIESDMEDYAKNLVEEEVPKLQELCNGKFNQILRILIHPDISTPRQVKKVLNTFTNNLLIAKKREHNNKLEKNLLTSDKSIMILAKISVLQSDYSEIFAELVKDYYFIDKILSLYNGENNIKNVNVYKLFNKQNNNYQIKDEYTGLINFLIRNKYIVLDNLGPFIYLGQDALGLLSGDETQRGLRRDLISGNEKGVINYLEDDDEDKIILTVIGEVKNYTGKDLPLVLKAAYQLVNRIPRSYGDDLSNIISLRVIEVELDLLRLWEVDFNNLISVYMNSEDKSGAKQSLLYVLRKLCHQSIDWKTIDGKEMRTESFIENTFNLLNTLLKQEKYIDSDIKYFILEFIRASKEEYNYFPFEKINELFLENQTLFDEYFGINFFTQLVEYVNNEEKKDDIDSNVILSIQNLTPIISRDYSEQFILRVNPLLTISKKTADFILGYLIPLSHLIDAENTNQFILSLVELDYNFDSDAELIERFLENNTPILGADIEFDAKLDNLLYNILPKERGKKLDAYIEVLKNIFSENDVNFNRLEILFNHISDISIKKSTYDELISELNRYFDNNQRKIYFNKINKGVLLTNYDATLFNRAHVLYSIMANNKENYQFIKIAISNGITIFTNNQANSNKIWSRNFIKFLSVGKGIVDESTLSILLKKLLQISESQPELMVDAFKIVGEDTPDDLMNQAIEKSLSLTKSETLILDALEFLSTVSSQYINKESNNLSKYADFLIKHVKLNVDLCLSELHNNYSSIDNIKLITLINNVLAIEIEILNRTNEKIIRTFSKFFNSLKEKDNQLDVLYKVIENNNPESLFDYFIIGISNKKDLFEPIFNDIHNQTNKFKLNAVYLLSKLEDNVRLETEVQVFSSIINTVSDEEMDIFNDLVFSEFVEKRFHNQKSVISSQLVPWFKRVNMENKRKVLQIAKNFGMNNIFKEVMKSDKLTEEESILVKRELKFRKQIVN